MKKPIIFTTDDDPQVLNAIYRDLRKHYRADYRVLKSDSGAETLDALRTLRKQGDTVALLLSDQRMPGMEGVELLEQAREFYPDARRVLLTAYADTNAAIQAINEANIDYYLMKPWDPPEEALYPTLDELLADWRMNYRPAFDGIRVVGFQWSPKSHRLKDFLAGNLIPYRWYDIEAQEEAETLLKSADLTTEALPVVLFGDGTALTDPDIPALAEKAGLRSQAQADIYDVVIIGAGPSGLAASVYGASEGLKTLLIEKRAPGGQAGTSSRIENYLGFPTGLSGAELTRRAITQSRRLGAEVLTPQEVSAIQVNDQYKMLKLADGSELKARAVVLTMGVSYRKLEVPGIDALTGAGVYYGAARTEAFSCQGAPVYVVGGGNSAGQAAMYLARYASEVNILIRGESLASSMSNYLIEQLDRTENVRLRPYTEVAEVCGDDRLESLRLVDNRTEEMQSEQARALFVFIGAKPSTEWLAASEDTSAVLCDQRGFIPTGRDLLIHPDFRARWKNDRDPYLLETSVPGIFAAGDVRAGAMARVASAVGEGSMAIKFVHQYLDES